MREVRNLKIAVLGCARSIGDILVRDGIRTIFKLNLAAHTVAYLE
jgi:hypothetical protein